MKEIFKSQTKSYTVYFNMGHWWKDDNYEGYDGMDIGTYIGFANAFRALEKEAKEFEVNDDNKGYDIFLDIVDAEFGDLVYRKVIRKLDGSEIKDFDADSIENKTDFIKKHKYFFNMNKICEYTSFVTYDDYKEWDKTGSFDYSDPDSFLSDLIYTMLRRSRSY